MIHIKSRPTAPYLLSYTSRNVERSARAMDGWSKRALTRERKVALIISLTFLFQQTVMYANVT